MGQKRDTCGMVYYDRETGFLYHTHREEGFVLVVCRYELGRSIHPVENKPFHNRAEAQNYLDSLAARENLTREPGLAGRWS